MSASEPGEDRRFRLHSAPHLVIGVDGRAIAANPACERVFGASPGALRGCLVSDLVHTEDRAGFAAELARLVEGEEALVWCARLVRPDGAVRFTEWSAVASRGEGAIHAIVHDVTERHAATEEAREKERFLATLMSNLPGMVYRCRNDPMWTMEFVSAGSEELTGYTADELIDNKESSIGELIVEDDRVVVWDGVQAGLARRASFILKYRIRTRSGGEKWIHEKGRGIFGAEGELVAIEGFMTDITASVRAEQELHEKIRVIEAQRDAIRRLSTPIIEVWRGVLTLPIVGALDEARAADITQALLDAVVERRARRAIIDLTGVEAMDGSTADRLVRMIRAVELLGARGVIVGIRPEVAQTLASLRVDLSSVSTLSDLRRALLACMTQGG